MLVPGYAYSPNEDSEMNRRTDRMSYLRNNNFYQFIEVNKSVPGYTVHRYTGKILPGFVEAILPEDILIWLDGFSMAPFGGVIDYDHNSGHFSATVYTD